MTKFKRGDIVLVLFPDSNLQTAKRRPVLIVQADELGTRLKQVIVAMVTSNLAREGHPSRVLVERQTTAGQQSGLIADSVIMTDNLATISTAAIDRTIGIWPDMAAVEIALCHTFGISQNP